MTTTTVPKNKTGLFAADTLQEVKRIRNQTNPLQILSSQCRPMSTTNVLTEQNPVAKNDLQSYERNNRIRNGFRPSIIRRQKSSSIINTSMMIHDNNHYRDLKDISAKELFSTSPSSARLKSEIDQLNGQLKIYGDLNKMLRLQNNRDITSTPPSVVSISTSCRLSSASTNQTASRLHQRFSSALTDTSNKSVTATPSSPINEEEYNQNDFDHHNTHAYRIPQQSNVGSDSIFPLNSSSSSLSTTKTRSTKSNRHSQGKKPISCPFYVMYFTNLAIQQRPNSSHRIPSAISTATIRKGTATSHHSSRRHVHSPISINTYSTMDDDNDSTINTTSYYNNKRFSAKMTAFEIENSHLLKDILRTTSWNHIQV